MRAWLAVAASACVVAACSLGALDGFSGGGAAVEDGGADTGPSSVEAGGPDGDAGSEASPGGPFCKTLVPSPVACADFDDGTIPGRFGQSSDPTILVVDDEGKSGTKGLRTIASGDAGGSEGTCITVALAGSRKGVVIEADVRLDAAGSFDFDVLNFRYDVAHELAIHLKGNSLEFEEDVPADGGSSERYGTTTGTLSTNYRRLRFAITIDGAAAHAELFVDGTSVGKFDANGLTVAGSTEAQVGDCILAGARNWTLHYDNVVVDETK